MADEKEFVIIVKAKDLVKHTFKMATAKRFPNKYRFTIWEYERAVYGASGEPPDIKPYSLKSVYGDFFHGR